MKYIIKNKNKFIVSERDLLLSKELEEQDLSEHTCLVIRQKFFAHD